MSIFSLAHISMACFSLPSSPPDHAQFSVVFQKAEGFLLSGFCPPFHPLLMRLFRVSPLVVEEVLKVWQQRELVVDRSFSSGLDAFSFSPSSVTPPISSGGEGRSSNKKRGRDSFPHLLVSSGAFKMNFFLVPLWVKKSPGAKDSHSI